jgi:hypothetical protein
LEFTVPTVIENQSVASVGKLAVEAGSRPVKKDNFSGKSNKKAIFNFNEDHKCDLHNPTFGEPVPLLADLATAPAFKLGDTIQVSVKCKPTGLVLLSGKEQLLGTAVIPIPWETEQPTAMEEEGELEEEDGSDEQWAKLRDVYDIELEDTGTFRSPFQNWPIFLGSENEPQGGSLFASNKGKHKVGEIKGFVTMAPRVTLCQHWRDDEATALVSLTVCPDVPERFLFCYFG